jgi:hypothetical protein
MMTTPSQDFALAVRRRSATKSCKVVQWCAPARAGARVGLRLGCKSTAISAPAKSIYALRIVRASLHPFSKLIVFSGDGQQMPFGFLLIHQLGDGPSFRRALVPRQALQSVNLRQRALLRYATWAAVLQILPIVHKRSGHEGVQDAVQQAWNDFGAVFEQTAEALRYA